MVVVVVVVVLVVLVVLLRGAWWCLNVNIVIGFWPEAIDHAFCLWHHKFLNLKSLAN